MRRSTRRVKCILGLLVLMGIVSPGRAADVPALLNAQGRLASGTNLVNGTTELSFRIYPSEFSAAPVFEDSNSVAVVDGLYSTLLGDQVTLGSLSNVFTTSADAWLEVLVNGTALTPRERIVSSGYAIMAGDVRDGAITSIKIASGSIQSNHLATGAVSTVHLRDGAVTSNKVAVNAISTSNLQNGAVTSNKLAPDSVAFSNLAKGYLSGSTNLSLPYDGTTVTFTVTFNPRFQVTPIVTTSLRYEGIVPSDFNVAGPWVTTRATNNFMARFQMGTIEDGRYAAGDIVANSASGDSSFRLVNGYPAVSFHSSFFTLEYYIATDTNGSNWTSSLFGRSAQSGGTWLEIVQGNPAIAYTTNGSTNSLMFTRALDPTGVTWAASVRVDPADAEGPSLAVVNGNPAIAFEDTGTGVLRYVRATDATGLTWGVVVTPDTNVGSGAIANLLVVSNQPAIAYEGPTGTIRYVRATDASGNTWGAPLTLSTNGSSATGPSMTIVSGRPAIAFNDFGRRTLMFARAADPTGGVWTTPQIVLTNWIPAGRALSLAVVDGYPVIAYDSFTGGLWFVRAADPTGGTWRTPLNLGTTTNAGLHARVIGLNNRPAIVSVDVVSDLLTMTVVSNLSVGIDWVAVEP